MKQIFEILKAAKKMLIVMQDYPDPDAIGSAAALKLIANSSHDIPCTLAHGGIVGRAENKALVRYLDLSLQSMRKTDVSGFDIIAMVDTQPGTGNNSLNSKRIPDIVIDHHPVRNETRKASFHDIRSRYGATSTILYEYLKEMNIKPNAPLATALLYGIRSDTSDLGRNAIQSDEAAFLELYPLANKKALAKIEGERLPQGYFRVLSKALKSARTYGKCVVCSLGNINNPDMVSEVADLLLRNEKSAWALCFGVYKKRLLLSARTSEQGVNAGEVMKGIVDDIGSGGGHSALAGGQISIGSQPQSEVHRLQDRITARFLELTNTRKTRGRSLV